MNTPEPQDPADPLASVGGQSPWAQWEYTSEEWHLFEQRDWHGTVRMFMRSLLALVRFYLILAIFGICLLLIFMMMGLISPVSPLLFGLEALGLAAIMVLVIPIFAMTDVFQLFSAWKRHLARRKEARYVIIGNLTSSGKQAIWIGEQSLPLQNSFLRLGQAILYEDIGTEANEQRYQPELSLNWRLGPLNLASLGGICVLVPHGHEEEARQLVKRFNSETIPAKTRIDR